MKKETITILCPSLNVGTVTRLFFWLAQKLTDDGHDVEIVVCENRGRAQLPADIPHQILGGYGLTKLLKLRKYLKKRQPTKVMSALMGPNLMVLVAKKIGVFKGDVYVYHPMHYSAYIKGRKSLLEALLRKLHKNASGHLVGSQGMATDITNALEIEDNQVYTAMPPVLLQSKGPVPSPHFWLADKRKAPVVVVTGRLLRRRGIDILIKAIAGLKSKPRLMVLGVGPELENLQQLVKEKKLQEYVLFTGEVPDVMPYMKRANVFAIPARLEGVPQRLVDALSLGTTVVVTNHTSGMSDIIKDGETGYIAKSEDVASLAKALRRALKKPLAVTKLKKVVAAARRGDIYQQYQKWLGL